MTRKEALAAAFFSIVVSAALISPAAVQADERDRFGDRYGDKDREEARGARLINVAFGAGLNTAQPGNPANHHVIPEIIRVSVGDVVNFVVAGLHVIRVYDDGVRVRDVKLQIPDECEVNPPVEEPFPSTCFATSEGPPPVIPPFPELPVYYEGLNSIAGPPPLPPFAPLSLAQNRVEPVAFTEPGRYLVICAVLPHFNDGMYAIVEVRPSGADDDRGSHH